MVTDIGPSVASPSVACTVMVLRGGRVCKRGRGGAREGEGVQGRERGCKGARGDAREGEGV